MTKLRATPLKYRKSPRYTLINPHHRQTQNCQIPYYLNAFQNQTQEFLALHLSTTYTSADKSQHKSVEADKPRTA